MKDIKKDISPADLEKMISFRRRCGNKTVDVILGEQIVSTFVMASPEAADQLINDLKKELGLV